jgi:putative aldouronate transport system substrate-binding protein
MKKLCVTAIIVALALSLAVPGFAVDNNLDFSNLTFNDDTSPITFSLYLDFDWYAKDTWGQDEVSQYITELTGVSFDAYKSSDLAELGVLLAADDLPDIIFTSYLVQRFEDYDVSYAWDELIAEYCPNFYENASVGEIEILNNTAADGHIYTFKTHFHYWEDPLDYPSYGDSGLYVREDILQKLGMTTSDIDSLETLMDVYGQVYERREELGIDVVFNPHPTWGSAIAEYMGVHSSRWIDDEGNAHMAWSDPRQKEFLLYMNELYRKGYLYPDAYAVNPENFFSLNRSGTVFSATYNTGLATETNQIFYENGMEDKEFNSVLDITWKGEHMRRTYDSGIGWASCFISRNCPDPARAIKYMEFCKSHQGDALTQWGIQDVHYTLDEEGHVIRTPYYYEAEAKEPGSTGIGPWYLQGSGLGEGTVIASMMVQTNASELQLKWAKPQYDLLTYLKSTYVSAPYWYFARVASDTDEYTIQTKLDTYWRTTTTSIILCDDADQAAAMYDEMMEYMHANGLDDLEAAMTANYNEHLPLYADFIAEHPLP